jgi:hypothetical protein
MRFATRSSSDLHHWLSHNCDKLSYVETIYFYRDYLPCILPCIESPIDNILTADYPHLSTIVIRLGFLHCCFPPSLCFARFSCEGKPSKPPPRSIHQIHINFYVATPLLGVRCRLPFRAFKYSEIIKNILICVLRILQFFTVKFVRRVQVSSTPRILADKPQSHVGKIS